MLTYSKFILACVTSNTSLNLYFSYLILNVFTGIYLQLSILVTHNLEFTMFWFYCVGVMQQEYFQTVEVSRYNN